MFRTSGYFLILFLIFSKVVLAQQSHIISGVVLDSENKEPLSFASVTLKNHPIGTISNENGAFDFYIPESKKSDTLSVSFIGFNTYEIALKDAPKNLEILLQPANNVLQEVILSKLSPLDYIKKAVENIDANYPENPYQTIAYYREKFIENNATIKQEEAIFKTVYTSAKDTAKNNHQLLLYKPTENPQEFQFMREWIEKKMEKEKRKADRKGEEYDEDDFDPDMNLNFGGPESVLNLGIKNEQDNFLDKKNFKKYEYSFGDETSLNGEPIITIIFKAKKTIDYVKDQGKILISKDSYAIISIEQTGKLAIPLLVKPILFTLGLRIENPNFSRISTYQKYANKWYPKLFRWDASVQLTKKHWFEDNENSAINVGQVFAINKIDSLVVPIPKEKVFDSDEPMEEQIYNDTNMTWNGLNILKN